MPIDKFSDGCIWEGLRGFSLSADEMDLIPDEKGKAQKMWEVKFSFLLKAMHSVPAISGLHIRPYRRIGAGRAFPAPLFLFKKRSTKKKEVLKKLEKLKK